LLALVAGQDVEPAEGSDGRDGRWRIARRVAPERVISTVDPEARHTRKSPSSRRDGYRAHRVAEAGTGLITDEQLTKAAGPDNADAAVAQQFLAHTEPEGSEPVRGATCDDPANSDPANDAPADDAAADDAVGAGPGTRSWPGTATRPTAPGSFGTRSSGPVTGQ